MTKDQVNLTLDLISKGYQIKLRIQNHPNVKSHYEKIEAIEDIKKGIVSTQFNVSVNLNYVSYRCITLVKMPEFFPYLNDEGNNLVELDGIYFYKVTDPDKLKLGMMVINDSKEVGILYKIERIKSKLLSSITGKETETEDKILLYAYQGEDKYLIEKPNTLMGLIPLYL